jgi:RNA polymerase-binding transcription factor DksA
MEKSDINGIRALLTRKNVVLTWKLTKRDVAVEHYPDASALELAAKMLREVRTALTRIEYGSYEVCLKCDEEIGTKRLRAVPWTSLCIACQELDDQQRFARSEFRQARAV